MSSDEISFVDDDVVLQEDESLLRSLVAAQPRSKAALCNLGTYLSCNGHLVNAATFFRRALALDPECFSAGYNLLLVLMKEGRFGDAIKVAKTLSVPSEYKSDFELQIGTCFLALKQYAEAVKHLRNAVVAHPPDCPVAQYNLERAIAEASAGNGTNTISEQVRWVSGDPR